MRDFYRGGEHDFGIEEQWIHIDAVEDIPAHEVPIAWYHEWIITELCKGHNTNDLVFSSLPDLNYEELRECYADDLFLTYYERLGASGAPRCIRDLGKLLKGALGLRKYDEKRWRQMRWASRDMRRMLGLL